MKFRKVFSLILLLVILPQAHAASLSLADLWQPTQMLSCVDFEILGICIEYKHGLPIIGIKIRMWRPELLVETVKRPGDSIIPIVGDAVSGMCATALKALTGALVTSGSTGSSGISNMQFNEVHVYDYPFKNLLAGVLPLWCWEDFASFGSAGFFRYMTELDFLEWRFGVMETITHPEIALNISCIAPIRTRICMGYWGPIYPRTGAIIHQSEVVGSAGAVFRAVSNASIHGRNHHHVRINPIWWRPSVNDKIQMLYPKVTGCMKIGRNPALWESFKTSPSGEYCWLYWRSVECCIL